MFMCMCICTCMYLMFGYIITIACSADKAYREMKTQGRSQSIVVSGEYSVLFHLDHALQSENISYSKNILFFPPPQVTVGFSPFSIFNLPLSVVGHFSLFPPSLPPQLFLLIFFSISLCSFSRPNYSHRCVFVCMLFLICKILYILYQLLKNGKGIGMCGLIWSHIYGL